MKNLKIILILTSIILLSFSIYFTKNVRLDASSDSLIMKNDETFEYFKYYNNIFPAKNFLILAIKSKENINSLYIKNINKIKKQIDKLPEVNSTFSIVDAPILLLNNLNLSDLADPNIENINNSNIDLNLILEELSTSPIFKDQIINSQKNLSSIIIYIGNNKEFDKIIDIKRNTLKNNENYQKINLQYKDEKLKNNISKDILLKKIRAIIANQSNEYEYFLGGIDMIASDTISFIKKDILVFSFAVILFIIIVLHLIYRDLKWVLIPLITTTYSVLTMTGLIGFFNWEITAISSNFISLMLILSISMNIHIINHYQTNYKNTDDFNNFKYTFTQMFWPCLYTALTTIVAFGSLIFSNIKPIIDFGFIMVVSLLIIFLSSFTILPLLIYLFPEVKKIKNYDFSILKTLQIISIKHSKKIILLNIVFFVISIVGINKLNVENSFINYFKSDTQIHKGMKLIDTELGGTTPLDIIIKFKESNASDKIDENINEELTIEENDYELEDEIFNLDEDLFLNENETKDIWFTKDKINTIKKIHEYLESRQEIGKVQSLYSLINMANLINKKELSIFELSILYNEIPINYKNDLISPFLSSENNMIKIATRVRDSNEIKRDILISDVRKYLNDNFVNISEFKVNGLLVLYNNMLQSLFSSQIKSFGIIILSIFMMFIILFKSLKLSIIGIIPNIFASSSIIGLIGLLNIPLDIMTITIAAITIGIAVDNTIHYIYKIRESKKSIKSITEAIEKAHISVGKAVLTTSLTIAFGFSVLSLSNFIPTVLFGIFTSLAMILAMIGVLITLPSILYKLYDNDK